MMTAQSDRADTEALRLYRALKREILGAGFRPGQALAEEELAHRFGASRTPIREALIRLQADGLVRIEPRRGAFVQALTVTDFLDINERLSVIEAHAARLVAGRVAGETVQSFLDALVDVRVDVPTADDFQKLEILDLHADNAIGEASGSADLNRIMWELDDMMPGMRVGDIRARHTEAHQRLRQTLDALRTRDEVTAETLTSTHSTDFRAAIVACTGVT